MPSVSKSFDFTDDKGENEFVLTDKRQHSRFDVFSSDSETEQEENLGKDEIVQHNHDLKQKIHELQRQLERAELDREHLQDELDGERCRNVELVAELTELKRDNQQVSRVQRCSMLSGNLEDLRSELDHLNKQNEDMVIDEADEEHEKINDKRINNDFASLYNFSWGADSNSQSHSKTIFDSEAEDASELVLNYQRRLKQMQETLEETEIAHDHHINALISENSRREDELRDQLRLAESTLRAGERDRMAAEVELGNLREQFRLVQESFKAIQDQVKVVLNSKDFLKDWQGPLRKLRRLDDAVEDNLGLESKSPLVTSVHEYLTKIKQTDPLLLTHRLRMHFDPSRAFLLSNCLLEDINGYINSDERLHFEAELGLLLGRMLKEMIRLRKEVNDVSQAYLRRLNFIENDEQSDTDENEHQSKDITTPFKSILSYIFN